MDDQNWQNNRNASLGGAGVSLAVALVALQVAAGTKFDVSLALKCSFMAIPFWLGAWQLCATVILWGEDGREHAQRIRWFSFGIGIVIVAGLLLALSLISLVYTFCGASWTVAFVVAIFAMFAVGGYHSYCVQMLVMQRRRDAGEEIIPE